MVALLSGALTCNAVCMLLAIGLMSPPTAYAAGGQCRWEGGAGAPTNAYCQTEDCQGDGGNALCNAGVGASNGSDSSLGPNKWIYSACEEVAGSIPRDAMWCAAAGGNWQGPTVGCTGLPSGFIGASGYDANSDGPLLNAAYVYANRGTCEANVTNDTGWHSTISSQWCNGGSPTSKLGILIRDYRRQQFSCGTTISYSRSRDAKCPVGYTLRTSSVRGQECFMPQSCCTVGNPVAPVTGAKLEEELDYRGPTSGGLELRRYYSSAGYLRPRILTTPQDTTDEMLPRDFWRHSYDRRFFPVTGSAQISALIQFPSGAVKSFDTSGNETGNIGGGGAHLQFTAGVGWDLTLANRDIERYNLTGQLVSITTRAGLVTSIAYSGTVMTVSDSFGHSLVLNLDGDGLLTLATLPDGGQIAYAYDDYKRLSTATYPDGKSRIYAYDDVRNWWLLTSIKDESGQTYGTYSYDAQGRAILSTHAGGADSHAFTYNSNGTTTITDPTGASTVWGFAAAGGAKKPASYSQPCRDCGSVSTRTFDTNGNPSATTDFNGNQTLYLYDPVRNLESWRTEAAGTPQARVITTQWHSTFRSPVQIDQPGQRTNFTYDSNGNLLTKTVTDTATNGTRTWTYTYNSYGQVLTIDGPRTDVADVTTYTYQDCSSGYGCGQLASVTDAVGNVTSYLTYNANGDPLTISDPNGVVTTLTYDTRERLTSRSVGTETTAYEYWPTGLLEKVTLPDDSYLSYTYDAAHRLTGIADGEGNHISYTLDAAGNRTQQDVFDSSNALARTQQWVYDDLGRLHQEIGAVSQATTFEYDDLGNTLAVTDPRNRTTQYEYDPLSRQSAVIDAIGGVTQYTYDARDNLASVSDPRALQTGYTLNGFNDIVQLSSPDSGTTAYVRNADGSVSRATDARSRDADYTYDAVGRVAAIEYSDQTIALQYDTGTNGRGHLSAITDASGSTQYAYDTQGRLTSKTQTTGSVVQTLTHTYNSVGQLATTTTPSGQLITYTYSNGHVAGISVNGTVLISNVLYAPFGPTQGWQWGNGTYTVREYDADGRVVSIDSAGLTTYAYNADGTIQSRSDDAPEPSSSSDSSLSISLSSTSNRISSTTALATSTTRNYSYDAAGNTTSDGLHSFTYNDAGRMVSSVTGATPTSYSYNGLGQRVKKVGSAGTFYFVYDEAGHLLGQYDGSGAIIEEIVWLDDIPIATMRTGTGGGIGFFYIHTDNLNTPVRLTRTSDNVVMWRWDHDPYGAGTPDEDAEGNGAFVFFNSRFPGQVYDGESGLHYNYFRDYDPYTGRYLESDPIGLRGGANTYAYVLNNPISRIDPRGLQTPALCLNPANVEACAAAGEISDAVAAAVKEAAKRSAKRAAAILAGYAAGREMCKDKDEDCKEEIEACSELCAEAQGDPDRRKMFGGSMTQCMKNCLPERCGGEPKWKGFK